MRLRVTRKSTCFSLGHRIHCLEDCTIMQEISSGRFPENEFVMNDLASLRIWHPKLVVEVSQRLWDDLGKNPACKKVVKTVVWWQSEQIRDPRNVTKWICKTNWTNVPSHRAGGHSHQGEPWCVQRQAWKQVEQTSTNYGTGIQTWWITGESNKKWHQWVVYDPAATAPCKGSHWCQRRGCSVEENWTTTLDWTIKGNLQANGSVSNLRQLIGPWQILLGQWQPLV